MSLLLVQDVCCTTRTAALAGDIVDAYVVHVLNHTMKTRDLVLRNSYKSKKDPETEYRDQVAACVALPPAPAVGPSMNAPPEILMPLHILISPALF